ncbi:MAG: flavodoxin family protein [Erysipelotrichaceae bacterium]|nr:flavodoxin family protein [Erysipelotrichaceae bacterium]
MKVLLVNGSPHVHGCTDAALNECASALNSEGIETDIWWLGTKPVGGCIACGQCSKNQKCVFDDKVNEFTELAQNYDGFIFGSPVYYSGMNGNLMSFMDRVFYSSSSKSPHPFRFKPAAAVVSARRAGTTSALDQINKYFMHQQMPVVSSRYWNMVHGSTAEDVKKDEEGLQIMRTLGRNMAWMLKVIEAGKKEGIEYPGQEKRIGTNFIR